MENSLTIDNKLIVLFYVSFLDGQNNTLQPVSDIRNTVFHYIISKFVYYVKESRTQHFLN